MKRMKESLRVAAEIHGKWKVVVTAIALNLSERIAAQVTNLGPNENLTLQNLISNVTEDNGHPEMDLGPPAGKEEW